jgi:hypothetical protein
MRAVCKRGSCKIRVNDTISLLKTTDKTSRRERKRELEGGEPEIEYIIVEETRIINGKRKKVEVKKPKYPVKKVTPNMIKKKDKISQQRKAQRIEILAQKIPDLDLAQNPINDNPERLLQQYLDTKSSERQLRR